MSIFFMSLNFIFFYMLLHMNIEVEVQAYLQISHLIIFINVSAEATIYFLIVLTRCNYLKKQI